MNKINELRNKINILKQAQADIDISDIFGEDEFEKVLHETYDYDNINYHMRKIDNVMFCESYNNYLDMLITDGFLENTDEYRDLEEEIEQLEEAIEDLEEIEEELQK